MTESNEAQERELRSWLADVESTVDASMATYQDMIKYESADRATARMAQVLRQVDGDSVAVIAAIAVARLAQRRPGPWCPYEYESCTKAWMEQA